MREFFNPFIKGRSPQECLSVLENPPPLIQEANERLMGCFLGKSKLGKPGAAFSLGEPGKSSETSRSLPYHTFF